MFLKIYNNSNCYEYIFTYLEDETVWSMMSLILFMNLLLCKDIYLSCLLILYSLTSLMMFPMSYPLPPWSHITSDLWTLSAVMRSQLIVKCEVLTSHHLYWRLEIRHFYYYYDMSLLLFTVTLSHSHTNISPLIGALDRVG